MRSPKATKVRPTNKAAQGNSISHLSFNVYRSGGSISLPCKELAVDLIEACNLRYHDHLAVSKQHKDSVLVMWENEKGEYPIKDADGNFDYVLNKQLVMEVHFHEINNRWRKLLAITFHLTGEKNAVVISGHAAQDWIDLEFPFLKNIVLLKQKGNSKKSLLQKSAKESFPPKLISHPGKKAKLSTFIIDNDQDETPAPKSSKKKVIDELVFQAPNTIIMDSDYEHSNQFESLLDDDSQVDSENIDAESLNSDSTELNVILDEIELLKEENNKITKQKDALQRKVDQLTATLIDQQQKIEHLCAKFAKIRVTTIDETSHPAIPKHKAPPQRQDDATAAPIDAPPQQQVSQSAPHLVSSQPIPRPKQPSEKKWFNVCKDFNREKCRRTNCRFEHRKVKACKFYSKSSGCTKGLDCNFLHIKQSTTKATVSASVQQVNQPELATQKPMIPSQRIAEDSFLERIAATIAEALQPRQSHPPPINPAMASPPIMAYTEMPQQRGQQIYTYQRPLIPQHSPYMQ